jgi:hypothetical protein
MWSLGLVLYITEIPILRCPRLRCRDNETQSNLGQARKTSPASFMLDLICIHIIHGELIQMKF